MQGFSRIRITAVMFYSLYFPGTWGIVANKVLYPLIHNIHLSAEAANIATGVETLLEEVQVDTELLEKILQQAPLSHSTTAIYAADSWASDNSTTKDAYDMILKTSREVTPMCRSLTLPRLALLMHLFSVGPMWTPIGYLGYKWSTRSVERLPPFSPHKLRNRVLMMGNTIDPVTPLAGVRLVAGMLGDQAFLLEQLGIGHSAMSESSSCTEKIVADYVVHGIVSLSRFDFLRTVH